MSLEFRGMPMVDPAERNVRFAGYPKKGKPGTIVICEISADALRSLDGEKADLITTFEMHKAIIFDIAAAKYEEGSARLRVSKDDILTALELRRSKLKR